jgi:hypothetical protein
MQADKDTIDKRLLWELAMALIAQSQGNPLGLDAALSTAATQMLGIGYPGPISIKCIGRDRKPWTLTGALTDVQLRVEPSSK